jgi:hypothetical protein
MQFLEMRAQGQSYSITYRRAVSRKTSGGYPRKKAFAREYSGCFATLDFSRQDDTELACAMHTEKILGRHRLYVNMSRISLKQSGVTSCNTSRPVEHFTRVDIGSAHENHFDKVSCQFIRDLDHTQHKNIAPGTDQTPRACNADSIADAR